MSVITSVDNPRIKEVVRLRKARARRLAGLFVAEGPREVERARAAGLTIAATYFAPALIEWGEGEEVDERVLRKMSYRDAPEGVIAVVEIPQRALPEHSSLLLVAVGIEKPGNLGAMARTADVAGADALLVGDAECDAWNPNAIRASTGAVFSLPIVEVTTEDVAALTHQKVAATLKEGIFSEGFFDLVVYANKVDSRTNELKDVFIYDERDAKADCAARGEMPATAVLIDRGIDFGGELQA